MQNVCRRSLVVLLLSVGLVILGGAKNSPISVTGDLASSLAQDSTDVVVIERTMDDVSSGWLNFGVYWHREEVSDEHGGVGFSSFLGDQVVDDFYLILNLDLETGIATGDYWATTIHQPDHEGESGSGAMSGTLSDGWVHWNPVESAWEFGGIFNTRITANVHAHQGSYGEEDFWEDIALDVTVPAELRGGEFDSQQSGIYIGYEIEEIAAGSHDAKWLNFYVSPASITDEFPEAQSAAEGTVETAEPEPSIETETTIAVEPTSAVDEESSKDQNGISDELLLDLILSFVAPEHLVDIEGWDQLTPTQQEAILALHGGIAEIQEAANQVIEKDDEGTPGDELTSYQQALYDQYQLEQWQEQQSKNELANMLEDRATSWNRIEQIVNEERIYEWGGEHGDTLKDIYQFIRNASGVKGAIDKAGSWLGYVMNPQQAADKAADTILSEPFKGSMTMEQVADEGLKLMSQMANVPTIIHYGYYRQQYDLYQEDDSVQDPHAQALKDLHEMIVNPALDFELADGDRIARAWEVWYAKDAMPGGLYDKAFDKLSGIDHPGVSK